MRATDVAKGLNHRYHHQTKGQRHPNMPDHTAMRLINHNRTRTRKDHDEGREKFGSKLARGARRHAREINRPTALVTENFVTIFFVMFAAANSVFSSELTLAAFRAICTAR